MIEQQIPRADGAASMRAHGAHAGDAMDGARRASSDDPRMCVVHAFADKERPVAFDRAQFEPIAADLAAHADGNAPRGTAFRIRLPAAICEMADA